MIMIHQEFRSTHAKISCDGEGSTVQTMWIPDALTTDTMCLLLLTIFLKMVHPSDWHTIIWDTDITGVRFFIVSSNHRTNLSSVVSRSRGPYHPTGTGKTLSYLLPIVTALGSPASSAKNDAGSGSVL